MVELFLATFDKKMLSEINLLISQQSFPVKHCGAHKIMASNLLFFKI